MVVWSADQAARRTAGTTPRGESAQARDERLAVLADPKSWGFDHDVRRPSLLFKAQPCLS